MRRLAFALAAVLLLLGLGPSSGAEEARDLRGDVPTGSEMRARLAELRDARIDLDSELTRLRASFRVAQGTLSRLSEADQRLAAQIDSFRESTRRLAVSVFVSRGPAYGIQHLVDAHTPSDIGWNQNLLASAVTDPVNDNASILTQLEARADSELLALVSEIDRLRLKIRLKEQSLDLVAAQEAEDSSLQVIADAWDRAEAAMAEGGHGIAPLEKWEAMRFCESRHDYQAVSPSGIYRGAYQFDYTTWRSVGGAGNPAAAPPAEQDARARELYALRGHQPWPVCGRFLR